MLEDIENVDFSYVLLSDINFLTTKQNCTPKIDQKIVNQ